jgi:DNA-binding IclR family transcriptional regulator
LLNEGGVMAGRRLKNPESLMKGDPANPSGALLRGLDVLQAFGPGKDRLGNAEISAATKLPKPTVSRLTRALVEAGYLDYDAISGKYQLRPRILTLGFSLLSNMKLLPIAHEKLQQLSTASRCNVSLAWPDEPRMIYLYRCSGEFMPYFFSVGSAIDMARTATGHAYLAALDKPARAKAMDTLKNANPENWSCVQSAVERAVVEVAERGFCLVDQEWLPNVRGIAAPLVSRDGRTRMSINCVTTTFAMTKETLVEKWGPTLASTAQVLSSHL